MALPAACLFDLDGLLLDTEPLHSCAWQQAAEHFGVTLREDQLLVLRGRRRLDCAEQVRQWMQDSGVVVPSVETLLGVRQPIAEALLPSAQPMPGAPELVQACCNHGVPMALVTSSSQAAVALKEAPHPWLKAITERVYGDDPGLVEGKPAPDPYLLASRRLGVDPTACWAFEDSPAGVRSAAAAGCVVHVLLGDAGGPEIQLLLAQLPAQPRLLQSLLQIRLD